AVMRARIKAIRMYWRSVAPWWPSPYSLASRSSATTGGSWCSMVIASRRDQVDEGEDHDPDDVDEVPVEADELDHLGLVPRHLVLADHADQRQQHDDADGDVDAVEAGQRVEARREQAGREPEPLSIEGRELVRLAADERRPEEGGDGEPQLAVADVAAPDGRHGEDHRQRAHQQHEARHR